MRIKDYILLFFKGMGMGGADVVPGVSGGTIALITGIYEELLHSIKSVNLQALRLLMKGRVADFWKHINGTFLVVLLSGIGFSLASLAKLIIFALENYPIQLWSFFFGLIIISAFVVAKEIRHWHVGTVISGIAGIAIAYFITEAAPAETPNSILNTFIAGCVAICAMILPGISGSFILVIMGKYEYIIGALQDFNVLVLAVFGTGCVVGLLSFSRLISWLLDNYHGTTIALLAGFMLGSLNKIWPWKETVSYYLDRHGIQKPLEQVNISPAEFYELYGQKPYVLQAVLFMALGIALVVAIELIAKAYTKPNIKES
jgi:putative membrane protein